ncbi:MAG: DUF2125 domain-containing protein [Pseudomonadota bacterium]
MKKLLAIVILAGLAWSGYWWFMADLRSKALNGWLAERRDEGWVAEAGKLSISGFPNRLDTFVEGLSLADPDQGWFWEAEGFQILSMSWKPQHLIAVWQGEQVVGTPYETIRAESEELRGSIIVNPIAQLELDRSTIEIEGLRLTGDLGWQAEIGQALLATRQAPETDRFAHEISFQANRLVPPSRWIEQLPASGGLSREMEALALDAIVTFDAHWNRETVETDNPTILAISLDAAEAIWGDLRLAATGELRTDRSGFADGTLEIEARNWSKMLKLAEETGSLSPDLARAIRSGLDVIAMLAGNRDTITIRLRFRNGRSSIGPLVIGPAPRLSRAF